MGATRQLVTTGQNRDGITDLGNGLMLYVGTGVFVTTAATAVFNHPFGTGQIYSCSFTPMCAASGEDAQDAPLYLLTGTGANVVTHDTNNGGVKSNTPGKATVDRQASGSSAMGFLVCMIGQARH